MARRLRLRCEHSVRHLATYVYTRILGVRILQVCVRLIMSSMPLGQLARNILISLPMRLDREVKSAHRFPIASLNRAK